MKFRKVLVFIFLILLSCEGFSQIKAKGIIVDTVKSSAKKSGKTFALIFGISKYKNPAIPQLQYADADARAFYRYLINSGVDSNSLILRTNETATYGEFWANIDYLTNIAQQGDKIYIYFSGHGDVENKTIVKDAFLLPYDAPRNIYPISAINVMLLKSWIATWSSKGIMSIFIADACRSGNLAGGREGMEAAANIMKDKWEDEIKILSCQPGELSLEGKQWGGGRGLFSYHLINGMEGLADRDHDGKVTLRELNLYMMQAVPDDAAPVHQDPVVAGDLNTVMSEPDQKKIQYPKFLPYNSLSMVDAKGYLEDLLKEMPDSVKYWYSQFTYSFDSKYYSDCSLDNDDVMNTVLNFSCVQTPGKMEEFPQCNFEKDGKKGAKRIFSCFHYLQKMEEYPEAKELLGILKRNLSAKMIDELNSSIDVIMNNSAVSNYPAYAKVQCSYEQELYHMLGAEGVKRMNLLPKFIYCNVVDKAMDSSRTEDGSLFPMIESGISADPSAAYLRVLYSSLLLDTSESEMLLAKKHILDAIATSPKFILPYRHLSQIYRLLNMPDSSIAITQKMFSIDSSFSFCYYRHLAKAYFCKNNQDSTSFYFNKYYNLADYTKDPQKLMDSYQMLYDETILRKDYQSALQLVSAEIDIMKKLGKKNLEIRMEETRVAKSNDAGSTRSAHFVYLVNIALKNLFFEQAKCYIKLNDLNSAISSLVGFSDMKPKSKKDYDQIMQSRLYDAYLQNTSFSDFLKKYYPKFAN